MTKIESTDKLIFVNIKNSYEAMINNDISNRYYRENIKECTRKYWNIPNDKADAATHILGCYKGIVMEVIQITSYSTSENDFPGRKIFEGEEIKRLPIHRNGYSQSIQHPRQFQNQIL